MSDPNTSSSVELIVGVASALSATIAAAGGGLLTAWWNNRRTGATSQSDFIDDLSNEIKHLREEAKALHEEKLSSIKKHTKVVTQNTLLLNKVSQQADLIQYLIEANGENLPDEVRLLFGAVLNKDEESELAAEESEPT